MNDQSIAFIGSLCFSLAAPSIAPSWPNDELTRSHSMPSDSSRFGWPGCAIICSKMGTAEIGMFSTPSAIES